MKNLKSLFGVCLGVLTFCGAHAVDYDEIARAASRTNATNISSAAPTRGANTIIQSQKSNTATNSRSNATNVRSAIPSPEPRSATKNVAQRTTINNVAPRATAASRTATPLVTARTNSRVATTARTATKSRSGSTNARTTRGTTTARAARNISRAATVGESGALVTNYTRCREIYYECMDEFCANKDANLRRCACSARANEFENVKKNMSKFEDKMLDFNQRLLLVNLDAEDVNAINTATEGEDAFYATTDKTKSKKALDEIAKKLNTTFGDDSTGTSLAPISLSLNIDSAFDTVDSFMGSDTTAKSGAALYNAAIPICRETAMEVCTEDELSLAISGYLMLMEQDCNTVQKAYQAQVDTARTKVFESGALLDMSRLDAYQTRNSDDILTCKRKMMEMLTNTTVCGANMEKCLDMTGKYIDPTTGTAFLTTNLADLGSLITRPDATQSWTSANGASKFITYLNNKKHFLAPAMENCQDIADKVWNAFIEDALAQIKLAQDAKLEQIRQACTTLTSECLTSAHDSISEFDARALSVFGVAENRTVNAMCSDVRNSCTALMNATGDENWQTGVSEIATAQTYDSIMTSCTQVGRNCIIQSCRSISGNFGLCNDIDLSPNRHAILERTACWNEVLNCVAAAGDDAILAIMASLDKDPLTDNFYRELYDNAIPIYDICNDTDNSDSPCAGDTPDAAECATCRIAESIWGNCETVPYDTITDASGTHNEILYKLTDANATLLSWFAKNTNTLGKSRSCVNTRCTSDTYFVDSDGTEVCVPDGATSTTVTTDGLYCPTPHHQMEIITDGTKNCCFSGQNAWGHDFISPNACCETESTATDTDNQTVCMPPSETKLKTWATRGNKKIVCIGDDELIGDASTEEFPSGSRVLCNGTFIMIDTSNNAYTDIPSAWMRTGSGTGGAAYTPKMVYYNAPSGNQHAHDNDTMQSATPGTHDAWFINYE